ncbi:MAG TPA: carboxypeptidase-like regulatory domain-containing protein, partial [Bacteroidales bacterium]|nr:carboxypeptidase-like regulatory domain-containing protein [Bacteroidales bacterium]
MKLKLFIILLLTLIGLSAFAQKYTLSGYIKDATTGEDLIGANIIIKEEHKGTTTNTYGFYSISMPKGNYIVSFSYIGYETIERKLNFNEDITLNINLKPTAYTTQEVVVSSE